VLARRGFSPTGGAYPRDYRDNDRLVFDDAELAARWFERVGAQLPRELVIDGVALVGTADGAIHRLDGAEHARWSAHAAAITSLAVSPTGAWASSSEDGSVKRWRGDQLVRCLPMRDDFVTSVVFRRDGALIATGYDGVVWEDSDVHAA
jgi:WD40 repeat protein